MANTTAPKNYLVGKDLKALRLFVGVQRTVAPFTVTWTPVGYLDATNSTGSVDYVRWGYEFQNDLVASVDDVFANYETGLVDFQCTVGEILKKGGTGNANLLEYITANAVSSGSPLVMVQIIRTNQGSGGGSIAFTSGTSTINLAYPSGTEMIVMLGTIRSETDGMVTYIKNAAEMTLAPKNCDPNYGPLTLWQ